MLSSFTLSSESSFLLDLSNELEVKPEDEVEDEDDEVEDEDEEVHSSLCFFSLLVVELSLLLALPGMIHVSWWL